MEKRNAEDDLNYVLTGNDWDRSNSIIEEYRNIARHWIPRAVKAEKKAKRRKKPQGQWLKGTPEIFGLYHRRGHLYWGVYYWANDGYWRDSRSTKALADAVPYARYYSIPIEIPPLQEETNED